MKTTLSDCLSLPVFADAKVLAGEDMTDRPIRYISVLEAAGIDDIDMEGDNPGTLEGYMLVTGFYGIRDDEKAQCQLAEKLAEVGLSALVLHGVGKIIKKVSDALINTCKEKGITLIAVKSSGGSVAAEMIEQVSHKLFYGAGDKFDDNLLTSSIYHLLNFEKYPDFPTAVRAAAEANAFQLVLLSSDLNPVLSIETQWKTTVDRAVMKAREKAVEKRRSIYTMINVDGVVTYWGSATINGQEYYMFVADNNDSYSIDEIIKLADIIELSIGMWKYTPASDSRSEFVKALRRGNVSTAYSRKEDAGIEEVKIISVFVGKSQYPEEILVAMDRYCAENRFVNVQVIERDEIFGILMAGHENCSVSMCAKLYDEIKSIGGVKISHVTGIDGVEGACDAFRLINENTKAASTVFPFKRKFSKYDLSLVAGCNRIQSEGGFIKKMYLKLLDPFLADKSQKGRMLLDTLETFVLDAGMNGSKTSEIMEIHANTVQYRLKKINEMLGAEITGNRVIPGLTVALALNRLEKRDDERRTR